MSDIVDIIHRLTYEVAGQDDLKKVVDNLQQQANGIETLKGRLSELQQYQKTIGNESVLLQQQTQQAIDKTTQAIDKSTQALQRNFQGNKALQEALREELGQMEILSQAIKRATEERKKFTDITDIRKVSDEIRIMQVELANLVKPLNLISDRPAAGIIETLRNRQGIISASLPSLTNPADIAKANVELERTKNQLKELQGLGKEPIINIRQTGAIEALNNRLTILKNTLKTVPADGIVGINKEIQKTETQLKALQSQGVAGGGIFSSLFGGSGSIGRQLLTGTLLGFGIGSGIGLISRAVSGLIEFAQAELDVIGKSEKLAKANEDLAKSFDDIGDAITKFDTESELLSADGNYSNTIQGLQRILNITKALGVTNGEVYKAEAAQLSDAQAKRQQELKELNEKLDVSKQFEQLLAKSKETDEAFIKRADIKAISAGGEPRKNVNVQFELFKELVKSVDDANIPDEIKQKLSLALKKGFDEGNHLIGEYSGPDLIKILEKELRTYAVSSAKINQEIADKKNEIDVAQIELDAKLRTEEYTKNNALKQQLASADETFRQLKEREDLASIDRIVVDTRAKYKLLYNAIYRDAVEEAKKFPNFDEANPLKNLPKSLKSKYGSLFADNKKSANQDIANQSFEFENVSYGNFINTRSAQSGESGKIAQAQDALGLPDFDSMRLVLQKVTDAKKEALQTQFQNQTKGITDNNQVLEAQKQLDENLALIDQEYYVKRVALAHDFFEKIAKNINAVGDLLLTVDTNDILVGKGTPGQKDRRIRKATAESQIDNANRLLPDAQISVNADQNEAQNANTPEKTQAAVDQTIKDEQILSNLEKQRANSEAELHKIKVEQFVEELDMFQQLTEETVKGYEIIANARQKDLDREISVRTERVDLAYKLAERGNTQALAAEQKALEQAQQQKRAAALKEQEINAALTVSNALVAVAKAAAEGGVAAPATIALAIAAIGIGFAEANALSASQKQEFYKGGFTGEGGKYEPAGVVHKGEFVFDKETTSRHREYFEAIHKGYDPIPAMALPEHRSSSSNFATKDDMVRHGQLIVDAIAGKQVNVSQVMDKRGLSQSVVEHQRAESRKWAN